MFKGIKKNQKYDHLLTKNTITCSTKNMIIITYSVSLYGPYYVHRTAPDKKTFPSAKK